MDEEKERFCILNQKKTTNWTMISTSVNYMKPKYLRFPATYVTESVQFDITQTILKGGS